MRRPDAEEAAMIATAVLAAVMVTLLKLVGF